MLKYMSSYFTYLHKRSGQSTIVINIKITIQLKPKIVLILEHCLIKSKIFLLQCHSSKCQCKSPETCMLNPGNFFSQKIILENKAKPLKIKKKCSTICLCRLKKCRPFIIKRSIKKKMNQNNSIIILSTIILSNKGKKSSKHYLRQML